MKIPKNTLLKIEKIKSAIDEGASKEDLIKEYFGRHRKKCDEFLEKHSNLIYGKVAIKPKEEKKQVPEEETRHVTHHKKPEMVNNPLELLFKHEGELKAFRELIEKHGEIMDLLDGRNKKSEEQSINVLEVPQDLIKIKDLRVKSQRISKKIEVDFDQVIKKFPEYSKTTLINLALLEFAEKYL